MQAPVERFSGYRFFDAEMVGVDDGGTCWSLVGRFLSHLCVCTCLVSSLVKSARGRQGDWFYRVYFAHISLAFGPISLTFCTFGPASL